MQTIIMTVGTSLRTNPDFDLKPEDKRPWAGKRVPDTQKAIENVDEAIAWMGKTDLELISAETNTLLRLDLTPDDEIILLHSETISGLECAYENEDTKMAISIETTGYTEEHGQTAAAVLREKLGRIIS